MVMGYRGRAEWAEVRAKTDAEIKRRSEMNTEKLLVERGRTHGDYARHAEYAQDMKKIFRRAWVHRQYAGQVHLHETQTEALDMIAHKIGRILAGDPNFADHWDDIAGYAKLCGTREQDDGMPSGAHVAEFVAAIADRAPPTMPDLDNEMQPCDCVRTADNGPLACIGENYYPPGYYCRRDAK